VIERRHGSGTYIVRTARQRGKDQLRRRLGWLYVYLPTKVSTYSQLLTFGIQREALKAGNKLAIEEMNTAMLVQGKMPEMIRRNSVDAVLLDGPVGEHHVRFLEDHSILYVVTGACPLRAQVLQVRVNGVKLAY
jgi:hypothetical protein